MRRSYAYVGPRHVLAMVLDGHPAGRAIRSAGELDAWMASRHRTERDEPFTYVVDVGGVLRLAPRRSEHVVCAGGGSVLGAGEMALIRDGAGWRVSEVSNQSTGYCPGLDSWQAVGAALEAAQIGHPGGFTAPFVFRRCLGCGEINVVRDEEFWCAMCDGQLPRDWNVSDGAVGQDPGT